MDLNRLHHHLSTYPAAVAPSLRGVRPQLQIHYFDILASTNQTLWQMVKAGAKAGTVVVAGQQTAGRGQRGRSWVSASGGIYASMLLMPNWESAIAPQLTFTSAWGIATLLNQWRVPVEIKWPNDLVIRAGSTSPQLLKLGGILTETRIETDRITQALVGVGLNHSNLVPDTAVRLGALLDEGLEEPTAPLRSLEFALATVLVGIWQGLCWHQQVGATAFLNRYSALLAHQGQTVKIGDRTGRVLGVTATGGLQIALSNAATHPSGQTVPDVIQVSPEEVSLSYNVAALNQPV
ncbi:MAG: biotin--[acetyl-CoA-carboxylase] ligase [Cyanobacteria bacterium J06628_6]